MLPTPWLVVLTSVWAGAPLMAHLINVVWEEEQDSPLLPCRIRNKECPPQKNVPDLEFTTGTKQRYVCSGAGKSKLKEGWRVRLSIGRIEWPNLGEQMGKRKKDFDRKLTNKCKKGSKLGRKRQLVKQDTTLGISDFTYLIKYKVLIMRLPASRKTTVCSTWIVF